MGEIPTQHLEVMAESFRHDGLNLHHVVIRATLDGIADLRAALRAAEKAREEADAYAGRANARIADLGERLDATEAVLRTAESRAARLESRAREALAVLTRLADSAAYWSDYDVPVGLGAEVDAAKARLAGVLRG